MDCYYEISLTFHQFLFCGGFLTLYVLSREVLCLGAPEGSPAMFLVQRPRRRDHGFGVSSHRMGEPRIYHMYARISEVAYQNRCLSKNMMVNYRQTLSTDVCYRQRKVG